MIAKKIQKTENFTIVDNEYLNDKNLSFKAKGILTYFLSLPGDWVIYFEEIITHSTDGIRSFRSGVDELIKEGYIRRYPVRENGVIVRWETEIFEKKRSDEQNVKVDKKDIDKLNEGEDRLLNTNKANTYKSKYLNNYYNFEKITSEWNSLDIVIAIENIQSNIKWTVDLNKLIASYGYEDILRAIKNIPTSSFAQRFTINFDWFLNEKNFIKVLNP